jgi:hypothetical protein
MIMRKSNQRLVGLLLLYNVIISRFVAAATWTAGLSRDKNLASAAISFPTLPQAVEMAHLSKLVYKFRHENDTYCQSFQDNAEDDLYHYKGQLECDYYNHDVDLGTQLLIVVHHKLNYLAVVFAGTDDLLTSLEDLNILQTPFGNNDTVDEEDNNVKVHAGFNNAVFTHGTWQVVASRITNLSQKYPDYHIWTTGHSLGAANSILTAVGLALQGHQVTSINFGAPRTGNDYWRDYVNWHHSSNTSTSSLISSLEGKLEIWRVVLGWDLVPRLPDFFFHVGHTIQLWSESSSHRKEDDSKQQEQLVQAYYQHYGDESLGYAGVPYGWSAKPYIWVPGAMSSHRMTKYVDHLQGLVDDESGGQWVESFQKVAVPPPPDYDDDDAWENPPDDVYDMEYFQEERDE